MPNEDGSMTQEELQAEYERLKAIEDQYSELQGQYETAQADAARAQGWDKWYADNVAAHYADPEQFTHFLSDALNGRLPQGDPEPERSTESVERKASYDLNGLEGEDFTTYDQTRELFQRQEQLFNEAFQQGIQQVREEVQQQMLETMTGEVLPAALDGYDRALWVRINHKDDDGFDWNELVNYARHQNIPDLEQAYNQYYGPREYERELEQARQEGAQKREQELETEREKEDLNVLTGTPVPKLGNMELGGQSARKDAILAELASRNK